AEIICDGINGFLTENNKNAMAAKIRQIMSHSDLRHAVGLTASQSISQSWESIIEAVRRRYEIIIQHANSTNRACINVEKQSKHFVFDMT
ncbi:MAG: hypothetical protein LBQ01_02635, partial [Prevotellaceae bacterium]|nr:hypothetical protein [Prevotellaceae bacterium]